MVDWSQRLVLIYCIIGWSVWCITAAATASEFDKTVGILTFLLPMYILRETYKVREKISVRHS